MGRFLWSVGGWILAILVGGGLWLDLQGEKRGRREAEQSEAIWQARYAEKVIESERVADTVIREVTKTRTLRDSFIERITDTVIARQYIYQTDTLRMACERCAEQLRALRATSDSLLRFKDQRIAALKPTKWERVRPWVFLAGGFYVGAKLRVP